MRSITVHGANWTVRVFEGPSAIGRRAPRVGWEALLFEAAEPRAIQRLVYRPLGWLTRATPDELALALSEGEWVRTRWGDDARPVARDG